ncbi:hypothetical protein HOK51_09100 [Candidatus Woesearchaeota archaeon]|jgi:hypothetical protein|nr:hypothetical protein [Candidatus Woesearchaeota archaeon]MBT6519986.1 hypothetical protein [Candidatus Woesearchaeota archaeon]MBT7367813.1 hypothetical protein [Candidatus Woesearchaeota archaeon]
MDVKELGKTVKELALNAEHKLYNAVTRIVGPTMEKMFFYANQPDSRLPVNEHRQNGGDQFAKDTQYHRRIHMGDNHQ